MGPAVFVSAAAALTLLLGGGSTRTSSGLSRATVSTPKMLPVHPGRAWPLPGYPSLSSAYGWRIHPITRKPQFHTGIDIPAPLGTAVLSPVAGRVVRIDRDCGDPTRCPNGNAVFVQDAEGFLWALLHLHRTRVAVGQTVGVGETLAWVGTTGRTTGPHLHLQVTRDGKTQDPLTLVRA